jgi:hypothetical protein
MYTVILDLITMLSVFASEMFGYAFEFYYANRGPHRP